MATASNDTDRKARHTVPRGSRRGKRREFYAHLLLYALVNGLLVVIWAVVDSHMVFWPIFPILGWGIGVIMNAWDVYHRDKSTDEQIEHELAHPRE